MHTNILALNCILVALPCAGARENLQNAIQSEGTDARREHPWILTGKVQGQSATRSSHERWPVVYKPLRPHSWPGEAHSQMAFISQACKHVYFKIPKAGSSSLLRMLRKTSPKCSPPDPSFRSVRDPFTFEPMCRYVCGYGCTTS